MLAAVLAVSILSPPLIVPDEAAQFERAVYVSSGHALTIPMSDGLGVRIDDAYFDFRDAVAAMRGHLELMDRGAIHTLSAITLRHSDASVAVPNTGNYPFITYLPQAAGIKIAAIFTDRVFFHAIGGRIANGALAVALLILAVRLCPVIAPTLLTTAALPVSIFLSASLSQDASLIALSALLAALLVRMLVKGSSAAALAICTTIVIVLALARPTLHFDHNRGGRDINGRTSNRLHIAPAHVEPLSTGFHTAPSFDLIELLPGRCADLLLALRQR